MQISLIQWTAVNLELQFESFNAAEAKITHGVNVHPGSAKTSWSMLSH